MHFVLQQFLSSVTMTKREHNLLDVAMRIIKRQQRKFCIKFIEIKFMFMER